MSSLVNDQRRWDCINKPSLIQPYPHDPHKLSSNIYTPFSNSSIKYHRQERPQGVPPTYLSRSMLSWSSLSINMTADVHSDRQGSEAASESAAKNLVTVPCARRCIRKAATIHLPASRVADRHLWGGGGGQGHGSAMSRSQFGSEMV